MRLLLVALALQLLVVGSAQPAAAATVVPTTTYTSNTTWTLAGSPYIVEGDVSIAAGATLTVEPGVVVKVKNQWTGIWVYGTLTAVGTASARIVFTSLKDDSIAGDSGNDGPTTGAPGQWYRIRFVSGSGTSQLRFVDVRYGGWAGSANPRTRGAVEVASGSSPVIEDANVTDNQGVGIRVESGSGVTVRRSVLDRNSDGVSTQNGWATVEDSLVRENRDAGLWFDLASTYAGPASTLMRSDIARNSWSGVGLNVDAAVPSGSWPHGNRNNLYGNSKFTTGSERYGQQIYSTNVRRDVDWTGNYFGWATPGLDAALAHNHLACLGAGLNSLGQLVFVNSYPQAGTRPISSSYYSVVFEGQGKQCWYDYLNVVPVSRSYISPGAVPDEQTWGGCDGGIHAVNPSLCQSDPVNSATGSFVQRVTDASLPGIGIPFAFTRSYNSQDTTAGPLGPGWTHSYAAALSVKANGDVTLRGEDGQLVEYTRQPDGSFLGAAGARSVLAQVADGYDLTTHDQVRYHFNNGGKLTSLRDRNGQGLSFGYEGSGRLTTVTESAGRAVTLSYDAGGLLTGLALPDGRSVGYTYSGGRLASVTDLRGGVTSYGYDGYGFLASAVDQNGHTVFRNTYSLYGRVSEQLDALGNRTTFAWDPATQTATATDARGNAWKDVYQSNKLVKRIDPLGNATQYGHDAELNLTSLTDPRGNTTTMTYDSRGNLLSRTAPPPLSSQESFTYDDQSNLLSAQDGRGNTTTYGYDGRGNLISITQPGSIATTLARDSITGMVTSITDPRGKTTSLAYDAAGNLTSVTSPLGGRTTRSYDASGRLTSQVEPRGNVAGANPDQYRTTFTHDNTDNLVSVTDPLGHETRFAYDPAGNPTSRTDANNHVTGYGHDAVDRLTTVTAADGSVTSYAYDPVGNLTTRTAPGGRTTSFTYDQANRVASATSPTGQQWTYGYDPAGNLIQVVDANGNATPAVGDGTTSYGYDALNRLVTIDYSDGTPDVTLAYDANGNRTQISDGAGSQSYSYDPLDRLSQVSRGNDNFTYTYDGASNLTSRTYPGGRTTAYTYDDDGRLATVTSNGAGTSYAYDAAGNLITTTLPSGNGYVETRSYDRAGRLSEIRNSKAGSTLSFATYIYDPVGNPISISRHTGSETYLYDQLDRLTEACYATSCAGASDYIRYAYDPVGNRTSETRPSGTTSYSYNLADQLTSSTGPSGPTSYSYDQNGNQTQAGSRSFSYDLANRVTSTTAPGTATSYGYDGDGNRLQASQGSQTTSYLWDINASLPQLALERDTTGATLRSYLLGRDVISMDSGGASFYYHRDGLSNVTNLTSAAGASQWSYSYEPYGAARSTTQQTPDAPANPLRYTGQYLDSTGLYHLRARQYDPGNGRFTSLDPLPPASTAPYPSSYAYANNNPTTRIDPSGMGAVGSACDGFLGELRCIKDWFIQDQIGWKADCYRSTACLLNVEAMVVTSTLPLGRVGLAAEEAANEGIYVIRGARGTYVGQSGNITARFSQHLVENGGRFTQAELDAAERIGVTGGKTAREIAEQQKIDELGGIDALLNIRNPIGPRRFGLMPQPYSRP